MALSFDFTLELAARPVQDSLVDLDARELNLPRREGFEAAPIAQREAYPRNPEETDGDFLVE